MSYGIAKIGLERLTVDLARQLAPERIAVNCFRIDVPVASEGFLANTPNADHTDWEPPAVAAEGIVWMLRQPLSYSGQREEHGSARPPRGDHANRRCPATRLLQRSCTAASSQVTRACSTSELSPVRWGSADSRADPGDDALDAAGGGRVERAR